MLNTKKCSIARFLLRGGFLTLSLLSVASLGGCAVVSVASTAVSISAGAVGLAADATVGTAKVAGKLVGKAASVVLD